MVSTQFANSNDTAVVNNWLEYLGRQTRLTLRLDDEGVCAIGHQSGLDCVVEAPGNGSVFLRVGILPWEPEAHPHLAERCLVAQFMGRETQGASFGVDPVDGQLVLWKERRVTSLDEKSFCHLIVQILECAVQWQSGLPADEAEAEHTASIDADRPADFSLLRA
jgi:hypothetical protein